MNITTFVLPAHVIAKSNGYLDIGHRYMSKCMTGTRECLGMKSAKQQVRWPRAPTSAIGRTSSTNPLTSDLGFNHQLHSIPACSDARTGSTEDCQVGYSATDEVVFSHPRHSTPVAPAELFHEQAPETTEITASAIVFMETTCEEREIKNDH